MILNERGFLAVNGLRLIRIRTVMQLGTRPTVANCMRMHATSGRTASTPGSDDPWIRAMQSGNFARAWEVSDAYLRARLAAGRPPHTGPRHLQHIWDGRPLADKRVLVRCYHGLGDTIQFIRFAAPLREIAREVLVWAQPSLLPLLATAAGIDRALPLHDGIVEAEYDADIESMELPYALRTTLDSLPKRVPYPRPPATSPAPI